MEISGAASRDNAYTNVVSWVHRDLMKASGVDVLLTASFGGLAGIITGKSWPNALRAYRLITTVLLQDFCQSGAKTYQELSEYLEAGRDHQIGRL